MKYPGWNGLLSMGFNVGDAGALHISAKRQTRGLGPLWALGPSWFPLLPQTEGTNPGVLAKPSSHDSLNSPLQLQFSLTRCPKPPEVAASSPRGPCVNSPCPHPRGGHISAPGKGCLSSHLGSRSGTSQASGGGAGTGIP